MLLIGTVPFEVLPAAEITRDEASCLRRLGREEPGATPVPVPFRLTLAGTPPWASDNPALFPRRAPALVRIVDDRIRIGHDEFVAEIDPFGGIGQLFRRGGTTFPLEATLRTAFLSRLPLAGGLPLHAAGIVIGGQGVVFFGPSGAGKSTLSGLSPHPVLSDELVALTGRGPFRLAATGFWGTLGDREAPRGEYPVRALVELAKAPAFRLEPLARSAAYRRLLNVTLVPVAPRLWDVATAVLERLVNEVPVFRMEWSPEEPPWARLEDLLRE